MEPELCLQLPFMVSLCKASFCPWGAEGPFCLCLHAEPEPVIWVEEFTSTKLRTLMD